MLCGNISRPTLLNLVPDTIIYGKNYDFFVKKCTSLYSLTNLKKVPLDTPISLDASIFLISLLKYLFKISFVFGGSSFLGLPNFIPFSFATDRVIQQAMMQVLSPMFEPYFSDNSYGFRPNRSCERAIIKALEFINDDYDWIVDIDLEKFFDNVPHDKLLRLVSDVVKDGNVVSLVNKFLKAGVMVENEFEETMVGTPQGGPLSPLLSNVILNKLDKELEARGLNFVRYADDIIILVKSEKAANRVMTSITDYIEGKLGLKVNMSKTKVCC